jgi:hypothetical protein
MSYFNSALRWLLCQSSVLGLSSFVLLCSFANVSVSQSLPSPPERQENFPEVSVDAVSQFLPEAEADNPSESSDPLNSAYPIPWLWVQQTQEEVGTPANSQMRYYRSDALISPDGQYAAYSRIQLHMLPEPTQNRVSSVLFLENLGTGELQLITASSPLAVQHTLASYFESQPPGAIAILIPVSWSATSDRILAREFESLFGTDIASDYAVIWDRQRNQTYTIAPNQVNYSNAVLLGWSQTHSDQVLFRAGNLGDESWPLYAVDPISGQTVAVANDQPIAFGQRITQTWSGPQTYR